MARNTLQTLAATLVCSLAITSLVVAQPAESPAAAKANVPTALDPAALARYSQLQTEAKAAHQAGDLTKAIATARTALDLEAQLYGKQSSQRAGSLELLAQWYMDERNYADARAARKEVVEIFRKMFGPDDWRATDAALALADVDTYESFTDDQFRQLVDLEKRHATVMQLVRRGDYRTALSLAQENVSVYGQLMGKEHSNYSALLNNLAAIHVELADFAAVDQLLEESIAIQRKILGENHPGLAADYHNLGRFCFDTGDFVRAQTAFERSLAIKGRHFGEKSEMYAVTLHSLAATLFKAGRCADASRMLDQCLEISRSHGDQSSDAYATLLNNLAGLAWDVGQRQRAEELYRECVRLRRESCGEEDPRFAAALAKLAGIHQSRGDHEQAQQLYLDALKITEASLGREHPQTADILASLGDAAMARDDYAQAAIYLQRANSVANQLLTLAARSQSQRQELVMRNTFRTYLDKYLVLATRHPEIASDVYRYLLNWKGAVLVRNRDLRVASDRPELKALFAALQSNASQLSTLATAHAAMDRTAWRQAVARLRENQEGLERQLSRRSAEFLRASTSSDVDALLSILPDDVVLLDFIEYEDSQSTAEPATGVEQPSRSVLVFVVCHGQPVRAMKLGSAAEIATQIDRWRESFGNGPQAQQAAGRLKSTLVEPLAADLRDAKTVLISPDGALGMLPFHALPGDDSNTFLIEKYRIAVLPVPQLLPSLMRESSGSNPHYDLLLMGGIDYDRRDALPTAHHRARPANRLFGNTRAGAGGSAWQHLAGAEAEIVVIKDVFESQLPGSKIVERRGGGATEEAFCELAPQCRILHIATHGFFANANTKSTKTADAADKQPDAGDRFGNWDEDQVIYNPELLSGLVFAGANNPPPFTAEAANLATIPADGLLTAEEAAFVSMGGVQLAVLSACESAAGKVASGEGLLGVQRSFQIAGARSTIASLWKVNDLATRRIMEEFYRNCLQRELSPLDALRDAQLWALRNPDLVPRGNIDKLEKVSSFTIARNRLSPQYWAAFTLSGDWQ